MAPTAGDARLGCASLLECRTTADKPHVQASHVSPLTWAVTQPTSTVCRPTTHLVELEHPELDLLVLVLLLLGLGVGLLLTLLTTTQQATQDVQGLLLLNTSQAQQLAVSQRLAVEHGIQLTRIHTWGR